jgi:quercetin dioxygenase-like cupin family protein
MSLAAIASDMVALDSPDPMAVRQNIAALEAAMLGSPALVHIEPVHRFAEGLYSREVTLPAGCIAVGHIHAQEHICVISKGRVEVITEGGGARVLEAPATMIVPRGTKNCVRALEETVWTTVHATTLRDVAEIEKAVLLPAYPDLALLTEGGNA